MALRFSACCSAGQRSTTLSMNLQQQQQQQRQQQLGVILHISLASAELWTFQQTPQPLFQSKGTCPSSNATGKQLLTS
jgi:hypothetical protein